MKRGHAWRSLLLVTVGVLTAGCCETYKCSPPLAQISVRDQNGQALPGAAVEGEGLSVQMECNAQRECFHALRGSGDMAIVSAAGYKPMAIRLERGQDGCGNALTQKVEVVLAADTETSLSTSRLLGSATCQ